MIPDRIIEAGTLTADEHRASVEVRIPWYRALPGSCIDRATLTVDGTELPARSLVWRMNERTFTFDELTGETDEWWFPLDSAVLSGDLPAPLADGEHEVRVDLRLYIPYIVTDHGVLRIEEHDTKTMTANAATQEAAR
jgi:hypothetical protein